MDDIAALRSRANLGDPSAQLTLAYCLVAGRNVAASPEEAVRLVDAACAQDFPEAFLCDAVLYARGIGRPKSVKEAYARIRRAAALGNTSAQGQIDVLGGETFDREPWKKAIHLEPLAESPRIYVAEGFLPHSVCDWLINAARPNLQPARVQHPDGAAATNWMRTNSSATFSHLAGDLVLQLTCQRIATATGKPVTHQEQCNVLHYAPGQQYVAHYDFLTPIGPDQPEDVGQVAAYGQRVATVLVYLNDDYGGGETGFPRLKIDFKGKRGDALIFWNVSEDGALEPKSLHAGRPVSRGQKWLLSQWIREKPHALI